MSKPKMITEDQARKAITAQIYDMAQKIAKDARHIGPPNFDHIQHAMINAFVTMAMNFGTMRMEVSRLSEENRNMKIDMDALRRVVTNADNHVREEVECKA